MEKKIFLNYRENVKVVEEEEKNRFLIALLSHIIPEVAELDLQLENGIFNVDQKIQLNELLLKYDITLLEGEGVDVYHEKELIARWEKPTYVIKRDYTEPNPKKQLYQEMTLHFFSLLEEQE